MSSNKTVRPKTCDDLANVWKKYKTALVMSSFGMHY